MNRRETTGNDESRRKLRALDLFSGIGGFALALDDVAETACFCEIDGFCQSVLRRNFPRVPIHDDVRTLANDENIGKYGLRDIDLICGGFPCQDISCSGAGAGIEVGARSGLFRHIAQLVELLRVPLVFLENVNAIRTRGLDVVLRTFARLGYGCRWMTLSASDVGAPHKRTRWFLLAYREDALGRLPRIAFTNALMAHKWKRQDECAVRHELDAGPCGAPIGEAGCNEPVISCVRPHDKGEHAACAALGNAVMPKQCQMAFMILLGNNGWIISEGILGEIIARAKSVAKGEPNPGKVLRVASSTLSELSKGDKLPMCGELECGNGEPMVRTIRPMLSRAQEIEFPYPTPTHVLRPSESNVRCARRLLLARRCSYFSAAAIAGKCPLAAQCKVPRYEGLDIDRVLPDIAKGKTSFVRHVNVRWVEWLMGFPRNFVRSENDAEEPT